MIVSNRVRFMTKRLVASTLFRFCLVGAAGTVTNSLFFFAVVDKGGLPSTVGAVGAFALAVTQNYLFNQRWTFGSEGWVANLSWLRYAKFVVSSIGALLVNLFVLHELLKLMTFPIKTIPQIFGIACGAVFNYLLARYLVFVRGTE
jgi:putative flippase GtrA